MNRIPFVFATAVVATAAGCGSQASPTLTKAQVISRGSAICKHAEREVDALPQLTTQHPFAPGTSSHERRTARTFLVGYAKALDDSRTGLAKLKAPSDGKELLDAYLSGIGEGRGRAAGCSERARPASRIGRRQGVRPLRQREREHRVVRLRQGGLRLRELELDMMGPCQPSSVSSPSTSADLT